MISFPHLELSLLLGGDQGPAGSLVRNVLHQAQGLTAPFHFCLKPALCRSKAYFLFLPAPTLSPHRTSHHLTASLRKVRGGTSATLT